jgi:hypothetical protein
MVQENRLETRLSFHVEMTPPLRQRPHQGRLSALPHPDNRHTGEMVEIFVQQRFVCPLHALQFQTVTLILQGENRFFNDVFNATGNQGDSPAFPSAAASTPKRPEYTVAVAREPE